MRMGCARSSEYDISKRSLPPTGVTEGWETTGEGGIFIKIKNVACFPVFNFLFRTNENFKWMMVERFKKKIHFFR